MPRRSIPLFVSFLFCKMYCEIVLKSHCFECQVITVAPHLCSCAIFASVPYMKIENRVRAFTWGRTEQVLFTWSRLKANVWKLFTLLFVFKSTAYRYLVKSNNSLDLALKCLLI